MRRLHLHQAGHRMQPMSSSGELTPFSPVDSENSVFIYPTHQRVIRNGTQSLQRTPRLVAPSPTSTLTRVQPSAPAVNGYAQVDTVASADAGDAPPFIVMPDGQVYEQSGFVSQDTLSHPVPPGAMLIQEGPTRSQAPSVISEASTARAYSTLSTRSRGQPGNSVLMHQMTDQPAPAQAVQPLLVQTSSRSYHPHHSYSMSRTRSMPVVMEDEEPMYTLEPARPRPNQFQAPADGNLYYYTVKAMANFFHQLGISEDIIRHCIKKKVDGKKFSKMDMTDLARYGLHNSIVIHFRQRTRKQKHSFML